MGTTPRTSTGIVSIKETPMTEITPNKPFSVDNIESNKSSKSSAKMLGEIDPEQDANNQVSVNLFNNPDI